MSDVDLTRLPKGTYVITDFASWGNCRRCGKHDDLRMGSCFECSDHIDGETVPGQGYWLWDKDKTENRWFVEESNPIELEGEKRQENARLRGEKP